MSPNPPVRPRRLPLLAAAACLASLLPLAGLASRTAATGVLDQEAVAALIAPATKFDAPEHGEDNPGGAATSRNPAINSNAFSHSSGNIDFKKEFDFKIGNAVFRKQWVSAPSSTKSSDGLGPLFNARACQNCHLKDGRGHPPAANWPEEDAISFLLRLSIPPQTEDDRRLIAEGRIKSVDDPVYGGQLQTLSVQGQEAEGKVHIAYTDLPVTLAGGEVVHLRRPQYGIEHLGYGPLSPGIMISPRVAPQMIGLGLLELVPEAQILEYADPDDRNGDGISGKAQRVWSLEENRLMLGRFGHKAGAPSLSQQAAAAFNGDIGISSPLFPHDAGDCTAKQPLCLAAPHGSDPATGEPEIGAKLFGLVAYYSRNLAVPARRGAGDPDVLRGKALFYAAGCISCHRPKLMTGPSEDQPHLASQLIWPYTDLLLHDLGDGLADNAPEGLADGREWRTAPLWGIGLTRIVNGDANFLHDGRARTLSEAILWHGGEAQASRDRFAALGADERAAMIAFLNSL